MALENGADVEEEEDDDDNDNDADEAAAMEAEQGSEGRCML
jgi:hypothetical protein